jgi:hypothetical protein
MNLHQNIEQILAAATPEQKILWNYIFLRWGERISVSQIAITGAIGELSVYSANKMYFGYQYIPSLAQVPAAAPNNTTLYDETNAIYGYLANLKIAWDVTAAEIKFVSATDTYKNILFSRMVHTSGLVISFVGYRIGI